MNFLFDADALIEAGEICAAPEEHVLAVVDDLVDSRMQIGAGAAAEVASSLKKMDLEAALGESAGGRQAGYAGADDGDRFLFVSD